MVLWSARGYSENALVESHVTRAYRYFRYLLFAVQGGRLAIQSTPQLTTMCLNRFLSNHPALGVTLGALLMLMHLPVCAERAVLLVDISDGQVLVAENALRPSYPASLTKLMTLYLLFEGLKSGKVSIDSKLPTSKLAAAQLPIKLGVRAGKHITVADAINAIVVRSANDVAVIVAEAIGGSHKNFVDMMNAKAAEFGMTGTTFRNASGLPHREQVTNARDMAILTIALSKHYPRDYERFATTAFEFNGKHIETHNNFLRSFDGARGMKTGFTCKAGFNLVGSAMRDGNHLVGVVLGTATAGPRDARMTRMMRSGLKSDAASLFNISNFPDPVVQGREESVNQKIIATECLEPKDGKKYMVIKEWSIEIGVEVRLKDAIRSARKFIKQHRAVLKGGQPLLIPRWAQTVIYQVGVTGLKRDNAIDTCLSVRSDSVYCVVRSQRIENIAMDRAQRVLKAVEKRDKQLRK